MTITTMQAAACAELGEVLLELPHRLPSLGGSFPLLAAVHRAAGADLEQRLVCIAARIHDDADERRVAEYLLRHRQRASRSGGAASLIAAARFAAEMDVQASRRTVTPIGSHPLEEIPIEERRTRIDDPSVGEVVLVYLTRVTGYRPGTELARNRFLDAVVVAVGLAEQHALHNGSRPSLIAMRGNARPSSRLVVHLRDEFGDEIAARSLAHLLVGGIGSPISSALLWWAAQSALDPAGIPLTVRNKWIADLADADPVIRARFRRGSRRFIERIAVRNAS